MIVSTLGFRYIWIDAVCIIQDDTSDWRKEAAAMGSVYAGSLFALSALDGENSLAGIFSERDIRSVPVELCDADNKSSTKTIYIRSTNTLEINNWAIKKGAVSRRAWTLQERLLAPAVLHFGRRHLIWECCTHSITEDGYETPVNPLTKGLAWSRSSFTLPITDTSTQGLQVSWRLLVEEYSRCALTFSSDKVPALQGIANMYQDQFGVQYLAGLWADSLLDGLRWCSANHKSFFTKPAEYRAPSWSWMALDGTLSYYDYDKREVFQPLDMDISNIDAPGAELEGLDASPWTIELEGVIQASYCPIVGNQASNKIMLTKGLHKPVEMIRDLAEFHGICWCLRIGVWQVIGWKTLRAFRAFFPILERTGAAECEFRRVGLGFVRMGGASEDIFVDPVRQRLTLV